MNQAEGLTLNEIAAQFGTDWSTIRRLFVQHNQPYLTRQDFQREQRKREYEKALALQQEGHSLRKISLIIGTSRKRLLRILLENRSRSPNTNR